MKKLFQKMLVRNAARLIVDKNLDGRTRFHAPTKIETRNKKNKRVSFI